MKNRPKNTFPELLAPAGSWESLHTAIDAGADSIYFGVEQLNMRARAAKPFTVQELTQVGSVCRQAGVKSYLALNTLIYDSDLDQVRSLCEAAAVAGISAVIATDMAVIETAHSAGLPVHISTQTNVSNFETVKFFSRYADVIVLARELTLPQISEICRRISAEEIRGPSGALLRIEVFIHGALCIAISGKCTMSLALTNHSANRGDCFQLCRRTYLVTDTVTGQKLEIDNEYVMSPKDLCTIGMIDKLIEAGVSVLKIEGRGRPADYVYHTTKVYREAVDSVLQGTYTREKAGAWREQLGRVFNRGFWEDGYYLGNPLGEWSASYGSRASRQRTYIGKVLNFYSRPGIVHAEIETNQLSTGETIAITGPTTGYAEAVITGMHLDETELETAEKGCRPTFPFPVKTRRNDKIYVIRERTDWQS